MLLQKPTLKVMFPSPLFMLHANSSSGPRLHLDDSFRFFIVLGFLLLIWEKSCSEKNGQSLWWTHIQNYINDIYINKTGEKEVSLLAAGLHTPKIANIHKMQRTKMGTDSRKHMFTLKAKRSKGMFCYFLFKTFKEMWQRGLKSPHPPVLRFLSPYSFWSVLSYPE